MSRDLDPEETLIDRRAEDPNPSVVKSEKDKSFVEPAKNVKPLKGY